MLNNLSERMTQAFVDLFAANIYNDWADYTGGGPGYYGVSLEWVAPDGSEVDLVLTFRSGKRYCCFEFADHFAFYSVRGWSKLRACLDRHGLSHLPLPVLRSVRVVIEPGAIIAPAPRVPMGIWHGSEYQTGPFFPVETQSTEPAV